MRTTSVIAFLLVLLILAPAAGSADADLVVRPISRDGHVFVSFEWTAGRTPEVGDAIRSGLPTTFSYRIDVTRGTVAWFSRTVASVAVSSSVQFDNLTRRYQLSRTIDGRLEDSRQTDDQEAMERWLTRFDQLPVLVTSVLEANGEYDVRVRVQKTPRNSWFPLPWDRTTTLGAAKFTFLP